MNGEEIRGMLWGVKGNLGEYLIYADHRTAGGSVEFKEAKVWLSAVAAVSATTSRAEPESFAR